MKNRILAVAIGSILFANCNKKAETEVKETLAPDVELPTVAIEKECFQFVMNKDSVTLSITRNDNDATGELTYNWFEKDDSKGIFKGKFKGDTLVADYTFNAEGMSSVREVVFLKKNGSFLPGYGDMEEKGSKTIFKSPKTLQFDNKVVLRKTDCKK